MFSKVLLRADGNTLIGLGHLYRMFALAEMVGGQYDCLFLTRDNSVLEVFPPGIDIKLIPSKFSISEEPDRISAEYDSNNCLIILDGYQFNSEYQRKLKIAGFTLVYIDDLTEEHMYADLVINHSPHVQVADFSAESYTVFGLGMSYSILRPLFLKEAQISRDIQRMKRVFISFGGLDKYDLTYKCLKGVIQSAEIDEFHILLGQAYSSSNIFELRQENTERVFLYRNLNEKMLVTLMRKCDLAIVPTSTICYEVCAVNLPILAGYYVENQKSIYQGLLEKEIIIGNGDFRTYDENDYFVALNKVLELPISEIDKFLIRQTKALDGRSGERILELINKVS